MPIVSGRIRSRTCARRRETVEARRRSGSCDRSTNECMEVREQRTPDGTRAGHCWKTSIHSHRLCCCLLSRLSAETLGRRHAHGGRCVRSDSLERRGRVLSVDPRARSAPRRRQVRLLGADRAALRSGRFTPRNPVGWSRRHEIFFISTIDRKKPPLYVIPVLFANQTPLYYNWSLYYNFPSRV